MDIEFMKKFRLGSGLQNFHIRTPLSWPKRSIPQAAKLPPSITEIATGRH